MRSIYGISGVLLVVLLGLYLALHRSRSTREESSPTTVPRLPSRDETVAQRPDPRLKPALSPTAPAGAGRSQAQLVADIRLLKERGAIAELRRYLDPRQSPLVQDMALEALTELGDSASLPLIASFGTSTDAIVLTQVMKSLGQLGGHSSREEDKLFAIQELQRVYQRLEQGARVDETENQLSNAIEALALVSHPSSVAFLLAELKAKQNEPFLAYFIVESLGKLADPKARKALDELDAIIPRQAAPRTEAELNWDALAKAIERARQRLDQASRAP